MEHAKVSHHAIHEQWITPNLHCFVAAYVYEGRKNWTASAKTIYNSPYQNWACLNFVKIKFFFVCKKYQEIYMHTFKYQGSMTKKCKKNLKNVCMYVKSKSHCGFNKTQKSPRPLVKAPNNYLDDGSKYS